jgi:acetate---CoA ligase (ADP-forming)
VTADPASAGSRPQLLDDLLAPKTIAVVGASADPEKVGGKLIRSLRRFQPSVRVVAVSPRGGDGNGEWATSLADISGPVDQVLLAVPASAVTGVIRQAGELGAKTAVVYASGFGETGTEDGDRLKQDLISSIAESGMRVLGPNCLGYTAVRDTGDLVMAAYYGTLDREGAQSVPITPDPIALISQSGGVGSMIIGHLRSAHIWPRDYISTGNEYDVSLTELVRAYADDGGVRVIAIYVEGVQDRNDLSEAIGVARRAGKVVACMVGGRNSAGSRAVESHSGRLSQRGDLYVQFLEGCGAAVASGPWEMALVIERALRGQQRPLGKRAAVVAASGGMGTVTADILDEQGFQLPEFTTETGAVITGQIPSFAQVGNPLDIGGVTMQNPERMPVITRAVLSDPAVDLVVVTAGSMNAGALNIARSVVGASAESTKPMVVYWPHGRVDAADLLWQAGVPCFGNEADLRLWLSSGWPAQAGSAAEAVAADPVASPAAKALRGEAVAGQPIAETAAKRIMQILAFEIPQGVVVTDADQLPEAIKEIDLPLVLKGVAPSVVHKEQRGLVAVNLRNASQVSAAFERIHAALRESGLGANVLVEKYWPARHEVIVGWSRTPLGTLLVFGTGGARVEDIGDIRREFLPLTDAKIDRLLTGTVVGRTILAQLPTVADRLRVQLRRVAKLAEDTADVDYDLDINPIAVTALGRLVVLDACFSPAGAPDESGRG